MRPCCWFRNARRGAERAELESSVLLPYSSLEEEKIRLSIHCNAYVSRDFFRFFQGKVKKFLKDGLTEDAAKKAETDIQNLTNDFSSKVDKHLELKEKEIMTV